MGDASALTGSSGITVQISGNDFDVLENISSDVRAIMETQEGLTEVTDSFVEGDPTLQVIIDRDKAMEYGLTVAQIYAGIADHTSTSVDAVTITVDGNDMTVSIVDNTDELTRENLMDIEFEAVDMMGASSASAGADQSSFSSLEDMFAGFTEDEDTDANCTIRTVVPTRTFLEKLFLLAEEFQKERPRSVRMSRHLYDLEKLMDTEYGKEALAERTLYEAIVEHRRAYYALKYVNYDLHNPATINFMIPEQAMEAWKTDYADMRRFFIYGQSLDFETLILRMEELQKKIRALVK